MANIQYGHIYSHMVTSHMIILSQVIWSYGHIVITSYPAITTRTLIGDDTQNCVKTDQQYEGCWHPDTDTSHTPTEE